MNIGDVVILGITQGLTEFLPVSSSGHLVLVRQLMGISDMSGTTIDAFLHLGTLGAVLWYYRQVWKELAQGLFSVDSVQASLQRQLAVKLVIATLPAAVIGFLFADDIERLFRSPQAVAVGLLITAGVLLTDWFWQTQIEKKEVSRKDAWLIGLAQMLALIPGISRSGMTIMAGRARGLNRNQAVTFSFLMSAPIIAGAGFSSSASLVLNQTITPFLLLIGLLASFVSGVIAISFIVKLVERISLLPFALYLLLIAGIVWYVG